MIPELAANMTCDQCDDRGWCVRVGEEPYYESDYESATCHLCSDCLKEALAVVQKKHDERAAELAALIEKARALPAPTEEQKEHAACFAFGNLAMMKEYAHASTTELHALRQMCRKAAGLK